jgi:hypothetical protein
MRGLTKRLHCDLNFIKAIWSPIKTVYTVYFLCFHLFHLHSFNRRCTIGVKIKYGIIREWVEGENAYGSTNKQGVYC